MKFRSLQSLALSALLGASVTSSAALAGCSGPSKYFATGSGPAASADAKIEVAKREAGSKMVKIDIAHLPPPDQVAEDAKAFVVWFAAKDQPTQKAGQLQYDKDERAGRAEATCSFDAFTVLITAEGSPEVAAPSNHVVIRQEVQ